MRRRELLTALPLLVAAACSSAPGGAPISASTTVPGTPILVRSSGVRGTAPVSVGSSAVSVSSAATRSSTTARQAAAAPTSATPARTPVPTTNPLTGGAVSSNPVVAVKIDNTFFEVPQFGVADADVVFVEQVEGGLTRLIAVFHSELDVEVGPIRSVRSTDAELLPVFGKPALVFSGGAGGPLADLAATSIVDTSADNGYFRSDAAYGSYNLHAHLQTVAQQALAQGAGPVRSIGFTFAAADARVAKGSAASRILATWQGATTEFLFSAGRYVRQRDAAPVSDHQGRPEAADNVLVLQVIDEPDGTVDSVGSPSYLSHTTGNGALTLCRDGRALAGAWSRKTPGAPFTFRDDAGIPLAFKPGKTWVLLLPQTARVVTS